MVVSELPSAQAADRRPPSPTKKKKKKSSQAAISLDDDIVSLTASAPPPIPPQPHSLRAPGHLTKTPLKEPAVKVRQHPPPPIRALSYIWSLFAWSLRVALGLAGSPNLQTLLILVAVGAGAAWYLQGAFMSFLQLPMRLLGLGSEGLGKPLQALLGETKAIGSGVVTLYCGTIGLGCSSREDLRPLGGVARGVTVQASQAMDLFQSVLSLGGAQGVSTSLHHVAIWELAVAVQHTSNLESRDFLGQQLQELGDSTRDVKDEIIRLNSQGINSFTWILHEFTRIEELVERAHTDPSKTSQAKLDALLDSLFEKISTDLNGLLGALDKALPLADRASQLGGKLSGALSAEYSRIRQEKEDTAVWKRLVDAQGFKGKQLRRDLELSRQSIDWVKDVRLGLEQARGEFLAYSTSVGHFKAGVVGYHISGHGLSAEEEVQSLKKVMSQFRAVLDEVKRPPRAAASPALEIDPAA